MCKICGVSASAYSESAESFQIEILPTLMANFIDYTRCDDNLPCYGVLSDFEIVNELSNAPSDDSDDEVDEIQESLPTTKERLHAITILR